MLTPVQEQPQIIGRINEVDSFVKWIYIIYEASFFASGIAISVGLLVIFLSLMYSLHKKIDQPHAKGGYNPIFNPNYHKEHRLIDKWQYVGLALVILGVVPWIIKAIISTME